MIFTHTVKPGLDQVRELRQGVAAALRREGMPSQDVDSINLAISELATNLVRHTDPAPSHISLSAWKEGDAWVLELTDDGQSFVDIAEYMGEKAPSLDELELAEGGMGLALVSHLFPDHSYEPAIAGTDTLNRLRIHHPPRPKERKVEIVVVDDEPAMLLLMQAYLKELYAVRTYPDAEQALQGLKERPADLIISDIVMPGMDGMEFRRNISEMSETDVIPFVFLTADDDPATEEQASDLGIDDFIIKPVRKGQLLNAVKRLMQRARQVRTRLGDRLDESITAALRPELPTEMGGFTFAVRARAASAGGGDFIFHTQNEDGHIVILADIMGHGVQAKFFAHAHAGYLYGIARALPPGSGPGDTLARLSAAAAVDPLLQSVIITAIAVHFGHGSKVSLAAAGHPEPLLIRDGRVEAVEVGGMLPGLDPDTEYEEVVVDLAHGRLLLFTDGLIEVGNNDAEREETERLLARTAQASAADPLDQAADRIIGGFDILTDGRPGDDATILLMGAS